MAVPHKRKVILPQIVAHCKPGELPANMLVDTKPYGKLLFSVNDCWLAWRDRAFAEGIKTFKPTSAADTYRSYTTQMAAWNQRMTTVPQAGKTPRAFQGKNWWLKDGFAPIAQPGKSNHNWGISVDVSEASGARFEFMAATALDYGFSWELDSEPWHVNCFNADVIPALVLEWRKAKSLQ